MEYLHKMLPHDCERTLRIVISEAEMISGRTLQDGTIDTIVKFLNEDIHTKFKWLTFNYLKEAIRKGLSSEYKYLDYKTICKWLYEYKNAPEMSLKIALESPLVPADVPEWMPINWYMEANKAFKRYCNGNTNTAYLHTGIYSRLYMDGYITMNAYHKYYKPQQGTDYDIIQVQQAQRRIIGETFADMKSHNREYIYSPDQYFKS